MHLTGKMVWDLSLDEIEYVYRRLHMDHYTYAALATYHASSPPLNRVVSLRSNTVPPYLRAPIERLLELSPYIGKHDPSFIRAAITHYTFCLYRALNRVRLEDISIVARLLAACAYLSIASEKNDEYPLWNKKVVRTKGQRMTAVVEMLQQPTVDLEEIIRKPIYETGERDVSPGSVDNLFYYTMTVIASTIVFMENDEDPQLIERALLHAEQAMRTYEQDMGHVDSTSPIGIKYTGQMRYRGTIYLYGGMFFERRGQHDRALDWYLKDIDVPELPHFLDSYLRDWKAVERLSSAYALTTDKDERAKLKDLIHRSLLKSFQDAARYGRTISNYLETHASADMRETWVGRTDDKNIRLLYGGEGNRELYFISLIYNKFVLGIDYRDIDYARFFRY